MKSIPLERYHWSLAEKVGLVALSGAGAALFLDGRLSVLILAGFILLCGAAPFFPGFGFFLPVISRGATGQNTVALTFDDGPDPHSTPQVLDLLRKHRVTATFFVTGWKAAAHPELVIEMLRHGHTLGNHSYSHNNFAMFTSAKSLIAEIEAAQQVLGSFGVLALAFRPPVGITGPRLGPALEKTGTYLVNFSCRAFDGGNRWIQRLSQKILTRVSPGDIIVLHDVKPHKPFEVDYWLNEIDLILNGIREKGLAVRPLAEIIGRPVMISANTTGDIQNPNIEIRNKSYCQGIGETR